MPTSSGAHDTPAALPSAPDAERFRLLAGLNVLDTAADPVLDGLARCAAQLMGCPIALVSLLDERRQWFKAKVGLDVEQTPVEWAFCAHAVAGVGLFEVPDTQLDPRFADNPMVIGPPSIRYYAGIPITHEGCQLGTLCVIDRVPRQLDDARKALLADLARAVSSWFDARRDQALQRADAERARQRLSLLEGLSLEVPGLLFQCGVDDQGVLSLQHVSGRVASICGIEADALQGDPGAVLVHLHPKDLPSLRDRVAQALVDLVPWHHEFRVRLPGQPTAWRSVQATPTLQADGRTVWHGLVIDVTAQKQRDAETAEVIQRWRTAVDAAQLGLITIDPQSGTVTLDARACHHHGLSPARGELTVDGWLDRFAIDAEDRDALIEQMNSSTPGQTFSIACPIRLDNIGERERHVELIAQAVTLTDGCSRLLVGSSRDVTAPLQIEQLRRAKLAAEQASRETSQFLSRVSHELRTPLNAILGFSQLLLADAQGDVGPTQRVQIGHVHEAGKLLLALVNDMLDLSSIEHGARRLDIGAVAVDALLRACVPMVSQMAEQSAVVVDISEASEGLLVRADARALEQVLLNLMTNGIKYNRTGGLLTVAVTASRGQVRIQVRDQGQGLTPEQVSQLFRPFERLGAERSRIQGSGLGLVIAHQLVHAMGGRLEVDTRLGQGSSFTVVLARAASTPHRPEDDEPLTDAYDATQPATLVYVEDDPVSALLVQQALRGHPEWELLMATDGEAGLALARAHHPAVLLSDVNLPGLSGPELVSALKSDALTAGIVCIALSGDAMPEQISAALRAGFDDYWTKPVDLLSMVMRLKRLLGKAKILPQIGCQDGCQNDCEEEHP